MPLPLPSLPSSAGSAINARMPLPPLRPRSSPLPGANTSGSASASHRANLTIWPSCKPHADAARAAGHSRACAMNSSAPSTCSAMNAASSAPDAFKFRRHRPGKQHVGAGQQGQMQIGLLGDLRAQRIDHDKPAALAFGLADAADEMHVGDRRVVAPDDVELGVFGKLGRASGHGAIGPRPRLAAHAAAQRPAIKLAGAELVEEPRATCCRRRGSRAGRRSSTASPPAGPQRSITALTRAWISSSAASHEIALELSGALRARCGATDAAGAAARARRRAMSCATLLQMTPAVNGAASEPRTLVIRPVLDGDAEAAGIRTIECADAGAFDDSHLSTPCGASRWVCYTIAATSAVPIVPADARPPFPPP